MTRTLTVSLGAWKPLRLQIVGDPEALQKDIGEIRKQAVASLIEGWDRVRARGTRPRKKARRRVARS